VPDKTSAELFEAYKSLLDGTRREILEAMPKGDPPGWKLLTLVLPVVLTSLLGLWVYRVQADIQANITQKVERESNVLQARLALTQDYYRERLRTYKDVHERVVALRERTRTAAHQSAFDAGLDKPISDLYGSYSNSSIFISNEVLAALTALWNRAVGATRSDTVDSAEVEAIATSAAAIETLMRLDLHVDEVGASSPAPPPPASPAVP
jgi:hypothetical protein